MKRENSKTKKGFTIIEVVLVLAIAGLIFLMVFVALPALQRSQRDTQRRDDMARFLSQINQYQANNNGRVPHEGKEGDAQKTSYNDFISQYLKAQKDTFRDPSGGNASSSTSEGKDGTYVVTNFTACDKTNCVNQTTNTTELGEISVYSNARCEGENPEYIQGDRKIAITLNLEGAGIYCGNN